MNEVIRQLAARKSARAFEDRDIPGEVRAAILEAAAQAPTAGNQQLYTILDVTDPQLKARLAETCDHQAVHRAGADGADLSGGRVQMAGRLPGGGVRAARAGAGDVMLAASDAAIAAQNAVTAAWSLGVGSCYIGDVMERCEEHREMLNLPPHVFPAAMLVLGYPTEQQARRPKPERFNMADIVCENVYRRKDGPALREMFAGRCGARGYDAWMDAFCRRKYDSDFSRR